MVSLHQSANTEPTPLPHWKDVLLYQGRSMIWLAEQTGRSKFTLYRYSQGDKRPSREFLERASIALGVRVGA